MVQKCLLRKDFDLLRNSHPCAAVRDEGALRMRRAPCGYTVPMYVDGRELLVFRTFSQSVSVPKRFFRHAAPRMSNHTGGFLALNGEHMFENTIFSGFLQKNPVQTIQKWEKVIDFSLQK